MRRRGDTRTAVPEWLLAAKYVAEELGAPIYPQWESGACVLGSLTALRNWSPPGCGTVDLEDDRYPYWALLTGLNGRNEKTYVGLDLDKKDGHNGLVFLERWGFTLEDGYRTPNDGLHLIFEWNDAALPRTSPGCGIPGFAGVEVKGSGNQGNIRLWGTGYELCRFEKVLPASRFPLELLDQPDLQPWHRTGVVANVDLDIERLLGDLGVRNLTCSGDWINFSCPFHGRDANPSAGINVADGYFHCFVCGGKNMIGFYADAIGIDYRKAKPRLLNEYRVRKRPARPRATKDQMRQRRLQAQRLRERHPQLSVTRFVEEVLARELGLSKRRAWDVWQVVRDNKIGRFGFVRGPQ
jgi:hypothetical protein